MIIQSKHIFRSQLLIWIFTIMMYSPNSRAAFEDIMMGARSIGLAGAYVAATGQTECLYYNPAAIGKLKCFDVHVYHTKLFGLSELSFNAVAMSYCIKGLGVGVAFTQFGNKAYHENSFYTSTSFPINKTVDVGFNIKTLCLEIKHYGDAMSVQADLGITAFFSEKIIWGCCIKNITYSRIGQCQEQLPHIFQTGVQIKPAKPIKLFLDVYKDIRFHPSLRNGIEYCPCSKFSFRFGIEHNPAKFSFGFGIQLSSARLDYAFSTHSDLGRTHHLSMNLFR